ncbi:MAG: hypothetical protein DME76_07195 [Verrucomicrobia bacterium]|nr:MAG: hypothetical protein DME76_07195 [Verrucomicrobiota bacterium]
MLMVGGHALTITLVRHMIARIWHGWTKRADAKAYKEMLRDEISPSIAERRINGYRSAELFIRDNRELEFVTPLRLGSSVGRAVD